MCFVFSTHVNLNDIAWIHGDRHFRESDLRLPLKEVYR